MGAVSGSDPEQKYGAENNHGKSRMRKKLAEENRKILSTFYTICINCNKTSSKQHLLFLHNNKGRNDTCRSEPSC